MTIHRTSHSKKAAKVHLVPEAPLPSAIRWAQESFAEAGLSKSDYNLVVRHGFPGEVEVFLDGSRFLDLAGKVKALFDRDDSGTTKLPDPYMMGYERTYRTHPQGALFSLVRDSKGGAI